MILNNNNSMIHNNNNDSSNNESTTTTTRVVERIIPLPSVLIGKNNHDTPIYYKFLLTIIIHRLYGNDIM